MVWRHWGRMVAKVKEAHTNSAFICDSGTYIQRNDQKEKHTVDLSATLKTNDDCYDPYLHREVAHPTTNWETLFHLLKGSLGTGILAMPKAFSNAGYALATVGTIFIGFICTYCIHLLIKCEYELCKRRKIPSLTYPGTAEAAFAEGPGPAKKFAPYSGYMVNIFLLIYQLGACCVYIVFIAVNIQAVANHYVGDIAVELYMVMFLIPLILLNWIRNLKRLAPLSTFANFITVISFAITLYYIFKTGPTFEEREPVSVIENIPLFFGTVLFALEAVGVIIPLENEMKTPQAFGGVFGVLNKGMSLIVTLYTVIGLLGYLTYGPITEGSITLNLPKEDILAQVAKAGLALAIFITYTIQYYVAIDITWNQYLGPKLENHPKAKIFEYTTRTVLVLMTFILAAAVPALDLFISLFGALCLSAVGIAIPAAIESCTYWYHRQGWSFYLMNVKNLALILFGVCGLIAGTYTSLRDIIHKFS
ncbi:proton-coupled amino acid transporter-like protein CG1139 isoform X1 [Photinus pyralis]|uniref:proton-coupled amino acid transporter-like protein CG1139 isoform X1 n=1 Tax=Photinus pyralis TaxID=7054 RepID=UPI0012676A0B|nr:proton-coupled amino acid transporter-like protein CG1139 isoform X1 [Photinus pyralis]